MANRLNGLPGSKIALGLALFAMPRHVGKPLRVIEELLTTRKQEVGSAIDALQLFINKFHALSV
jgi:hypothetical protein